MLVVDLYGIHSSTDRIYMIKDKIYQAGINLYKSLSQHYTFNVRQIKVETTKACNLKCPGCRRNYTASISTEPGPTHLEPGALWRMLATTSMMVVRFEGDGEPTCNPHFRELVKMCSDLGIRSAMTCNATLLNKEYIDYLEQHGMSRVHVSFDGAHKDTFEKARLGASFNEVKQNCKLLGESNIQLFMNVLLSSDQIVEELPEYVDLALEVGATGVHIMKYQAENLDRWLGPDLLQHKGALKAFEEKAKEKHLMYVSTVTEQPTFTGCDDGYMCPYVLLNGDVYSCSYMANLRRTEVYQGQVLKVPYQNYCMGNLNQNWMKEIWYGEAYKELRSFLRSTKEPIGTKTSPTDLLESRKVLHIGRFAYCSSCLCRWGESGI